jgi:hypothetical protein
MIHSKGRSVCVINLLTLLDENKDIIDVAKFNLCNNFDQTMMGIYSNPFVGGIISIIFK